MSQTTILVTGASGDLGQLIVKELFNLSKTDVNIKVIAATRTPAKLGDVGVEVRQLDFLDNDSIVNAFKGVDRVILINTDAIGNRVECD